MIEHRTRVSPSSDRLPREAQLAWSLAGVATDPAEVPAACAEMIVNSVVDNAAVVSVELPAPGDLKAVEQGLATLKGEGHQRSLLGQMQARTQLCDLLEYARYSSFDQEVFDFELPDD